MRNTPKGISIFKKNLSVDMFVFILAITGEGLAEIGCACGGWRRGRSAS